MSPQSKNGLLLAIAARNPIRRGDDAGGGQGGKSAASVMAINNDYYRFVHLTLAVSAINGCGACMDAHEKTQRQSGVSSDTIQTALRVAAIVQSVAVAIEAAGHGTSQAVE